jgi:hypothetical protein
VEAYVIGELSATAEAAQPGLGVLTGLLAGLVGELTGPSAVTMSLEQIERRVQERGRELLQMIVQHALDAHATTEPRLPQVTDAGGVPRPRSEHGHTRTVLTMLGTVTVTRRAYRAPGAANLYPRDAVLNLPTRRYSWALQSRAVDFALETSFEQGGRWLAEHTGTRVGKRQIEQIVTEAARDIETFHLARPPAAPAPGLPLVLSVDGKGVAMRPAARRKGRYQRVKPAFGKRLGTGEKRGTKRMAEVGVVFDARPPQRPRSPELIMGQVRGPDGTPTPAGQVKAQGRWYVTDITADRAVTIGKVFDEADRRDPDHQRDWIALADGDRHQITAIQKEARRRKVTVTILVDFIHVLEYLWKVGWCFHQTRDQAIEGWVTAQALDILRGHTTNVIALIKDLATAHPPKPGGEHERLIRTTIGYLTNKLPYLDYPRALAQGWPIATGVIEGACRHLVQDRMGITGARWGLPGAEAVLALRAIKAGNELDAYWTYHLQQEHHRNHLSRYQTGLQGLNQHRLSLAA